MSTNVPWDVRGLVDDELKLMPEKYDKDVAQGLLRKIVPLMDTQTTSYTLCNVPPNLRWRDAPPSRKSRLVHPMSKEDVVIHAAGIVTEVDHVADMSPAASSQINRAATTIRLLTSAQWDGLSQFLKTYERARSNEDIFPPEIYSFPVLTRDPMIFDARGLSVRPMLSRKLQVGDFVLEDLVVERVSDLNVGARSSLKNDGDKFWRVCWHLQSVFLLHRPAA